MWDGLLKMIQQRKKNKNHKSGSILLSNCYKEALCIQSHGLYGLHRGGAQRASALQWECSTLTYSTTPNTDHPTAQQMSSAVYFAGNNGRGVGDKRTFKVGGSQLEKPFLPLVRQKTRKSRMMN